MSSSQTIRILGTACLLAFGAWLVGCTAIHPSSERTASRDDNQLLSFDEMVLSAIRSNVRNVESTILPDDVVTTLGVRALGTLEKSMREDGADYRFTGQQCRLIVQTVPAPLPSMDSVIDFDRHPFDNPNRISEIIFEQSDGTPVRVFPPAASSSGKGTIE